MNIVKVVDMSAAALLAVPVASVTIPDAAQIESLGKWPLHVILALVAMASISGLVLCVRWVLAHTEKAGVRMERNAVALQRIGDAVEKLAEEISRSPCLLQRLHERNSPGLHPDVAKAFDLARDAIKDRP